MKKYYRNTIDLETTDKVLIESGTLFEAKEGKMVIVDDDFFAEFPYNEGIFRYVGNDINNLTD